MRHPAPISFALLLALVVCPANPLAAQPAVPEPDAMPPDHDALQWEDFGPRVIEFAGYRWRVKSSDPADQRMGPGNNYFSDSPENVWVDEQGRLHLRITHRDGRWSCPEVALEQPLGYGDYIFKTVGRVDDLDPNVIFGLFLWEYQADYTGSHERNVANEFDIEFGTWKNPDRHPAQFVCQPWQPPGNLYGFDIELEGDDALSSHALLWHPTGMACRSWHGHSQRPTDDQMIAQWFYAGPHLPRPEQPRVHLNFWLINEPPADGREQEIILADFEFVPADR